MKIMIHVSKKPKIIAKCSEIFHVFCTLSEGRNYFLRHSFKKKGAIPRQNKIKPLLLQRFMAP